MEPGTWPNRSCRPSDPPASPSLLPAPPDPSRFLGEAIVAACILQPYYNLCA